MPYACEFETNTRRSASAPPRYASSETMKLPALVARLAELFAAGRPGSNDEHAQPRPADTAGPTGGRDGYGS
ncbi:MAG TPA: hypothetical protein VGD81_17540 [Opitutaceae bacterium]